MYADYFGLKEAGFSITPDPQFLYLSRRHREALAHLLYGTGDHGGFVLLTGEVGTGKTTVCRAMLEQLPEHVDVALILNPALNVSELLHAVCDEFEVPVDAAETSAKVLVDRLNRFLLEAHGKGRKPVLMIDEAQNLSAEVLEQIRLLTNLETAKHKLLQIFLVGQPELADLLAQQHLRQLAQRITARYHLTPLDAVETGDYIRHRLAVAGVERRLFTPAAVRRIHRLSGGVPRLINILCDRSLLGVYAGHGREVTARVVNRARQELHGERTSPATRSHWRWLLPLFAFSLVGLGWTYQERLAPFAQFVLDPKERVDTESAPPVRPDPNEAAPPTHQPADTERLERADDQAHRAAREPQLLAAADAMDALLKTWGRELPSSARQDPCAFAATQALQCREGKGTWNNLRQYRRPALIRLHNPEGRTGYALVTGLGEERVLLSGPNGESAFSIANLDRWWYGDYRFLWQAAPGNLALIRPGASADAVRWLRQGLAAVATTPLSDVDSTAYDEGLLRAVQGFQQQQGLEPDGIAGPETLIRLNTLNADGASPRLRTEF